CQQYNSLPFTC
nr:immunoglobulin light chain junction region [Macaca mulatta]MOW51818.1 immunoglobulin light chain junction region [Macaca mulatta]MPN92015.1 immunoglobulin light chain junction region [Macaca mulatta]MPN98878.1 immunoglobulin light chain junction region [Macaca mulatta]MPN99210.1 immunoglobulin light chain junction region [Macaca mulatta]